ncbi:MAG: 50S ribosomal protein L13 [Candidatus Pacebacteria bacterium]|jgi:large subunit ribosomal protein L13|nr:50S ribosomal protein L13 [Candidatus Paceibacterota bacterium]
MNQNTKIERNWHVFDASDENFGRMSTKIATLLRGKNKATWTPHIDGGDSVVIINTDKVKFSGKKGTDKIYYHHSGYLGGMKEIALQDQIIKDSREVIRSAVFGMLPKNKLRNEMMKRMHIYKDAEHPYADKLAK